MTKAEFEKSLRKGLGRCVIELDDTASRERFKSVVLQACLNNFAYDISIEGTRANYVCSLVCKYPKSERGYFIDATIQKFNEINKPNYEDFLHLSDLLVNFAVLGNKNAKAALLNKFNNLYNQIADKKPNKTNDFVVNYLQITAICLIKCEGNDSFCTFTELLGKILKNNARYSFADFLPFHNGVKELLGEDEIKVLLNQNSSTNEYIANYAEQLAKNIATEQEAQPDIPPITEKVNYANEVIY